MVFACGTAKAACLTVVVAAGAVCPRDEANGQPPPQAYALGYTTKTWDSTTLGTTVGTWQNYNFKGHSSPSQYQTQNQDGSITLTGSGWSGGMANYTGEMATAANNAAKPFLYQGIAFGGGFYLEVQMLAVGAVTTAQDDTLDIAIYDSLNLTGYINVDALGDQAIELDGPEFDTVGSTTQYGVSCHDYYWTGSMKSRLDPTSLIPKATIPSGTIFTWNTYGVLWVPATASTRGYVSWFFNGTQVATIVEGPGTGYVQYSAGQTYPPSNTANTICNYLDTTQMIPVIGLSGASVITGVIKSAKIWQGPGMNNSQY